jgi:hypothetical protein
VKRGAAIWQGAGSVEKARLAQMWMSWSPPGDCEKRAKTLEMKSSILGRALNYNAASATTPAPVKPEPEPAPTEAPAVAAPPTEPAVAKPASNPVATKAAPTGQATATATTKPAPAGVKTLRPAPAAKPAPIDVKEVIIDPANPAPCAGSLFPAKRGGKDVLICKAD